MQPAKWSNKNKQKGEKMTETTSKQKAKRRTDEEILQELEADVKKRRAEIKNRDRKRRNHALIMIGAEYVKATGQDWRKIDYAKLRAYFEQYAYTMKLKTNKPMSEKADDDWRALKAFEDASKPQKAAQPAPAQQPTEESEIPF